MPSPVPDPALSRRKRPTQREVAGLAGVSQAAVSQVLNGGQSGVRIPDATRQRVLDAMQHLGYVPNVAAQRLAGGRNRILGVFTYESVFPSSRRDFFNPFLEGIEQEAAVLDCDLLLHTRPAPGHLNTGRSNTGYSNTGHTKPLSPQGHSRLRLADGTIMLGLPDQEQRADLTRLISEGHPTVFIGRRELPGVLLPYVTARYAAATAHALRALVQRGHRRTLYVGAAQRHESALDRERGYLEAVADLGISGQVLRLDDGTPHMEIMLDQQITGILFENERLADMWLSAAAHLGLQCPQDFGFALLGDPLYGAELPEGWAHSRIPRQEMGRQAVRLLETVLQGDSELSSVDLPCGWVTGSSLGRGPG
ncbi:LacI family DNA-binding transcriptional regulator [Deinococcus frigens]|uniref:LacI family DNA-binding transcriptional regulator n=1 Tax=Deinococcus frigens TaxID=249403 RepID=UPI0009FBC854|nr:LacI family DNA-binding transcriptional regulator [Deinococcus frigens]